MQDFISTFSSSFQFVNEALSREEVSPHPQDCHDPPPAVRVGDHGDESPPRRLAGVARSDPWRTTPTEMGFIGCAIRRRGLHWVVESSLRCNNRGKEYLLRDRRGEDLHRVKEICVLARLGAAKIAVGHEVRPRSEQDWRRLLLPEKLAPGCPQLERGLVVHVIWYSVADDNPWTEAALMGTPAKTLDQLSKVVVGFLTGARNRGYVSDFSSIDDSFNLLPKKNPLKGRAMKVAMKDLKAVFFVWEFNGKPEYHDSQHSGVRGDARTIEVTFTDGEKIVGRPEGYNSQRIGFFIYPSDPKGNNIRIFVVTRNTRQVRLI